jgi:hypothetical protein
VVVATPTTPGRKPIFDTASSRQAQITSLTEQLQFAQVELVAQVDLLNVINETNVFGQNAAIPTAALNIIPTTPSGGGRN